MASNEWLVRKLHEQDKKIEALSRGGTGVGHSSIAPGENLTVISDNGEVVLGAGGVEHVDGPTPATPSAPTLKLGFGTIETTWDGTFAEGEDEDGVPLTAPVDFDVVEVHCSTDPEEEEWGEDTMRGQIKTREGGTVTVGGFDVDDEVFVCLIALAKTGKRSAPSATASLVIEGLDFAQLTNELDAATVTIDNAREVLLDGQNTLGEKLDAADTALSDLETTLGELDSTTLPALRNDLDAAEGRLSTAEGQITDAFGQIVDVRSDAAADATSKANAAEQNAKSAAQQYDTALKGQIDSTINQAKADLTADINAVRTSANGKNTVTWSTSNPPTSYPGAINDTWFVMSGAGSGATVLSQWRWNGDVWVSTKLSQAVLAQIDIGTGTFGTLDGVRLKAGSVASDRVIVGQGNNLLPLSVANAGAGVTPHVTSGKGTTLTLTSNPERNYNNALLYSAAGLSGAFDIVGRLSSGGQSGGVQYGNAFPVTPGSQYRLDATLIRSGAEPDGQPNAQFQAVMHNAAGGWVGTVNSASFAPSYSPTVVGFLDVTIPSSAAFMAIYFRMDRNGSVGVLNPRLVNKSGSTLIENGAVTTDKLAANVLEVGNLKAGTAAIAEAVVQKIAASTASIQQADVKNLFVTGTASLSDVVAERIAAETAEFIQLEVGNLVAGTGTMDTATINKLFSDVVVASMAQAEQFIGENAILTGAVTAPKITASEELWAKIAQFVQIRAEHIEADAIDGMVITGPNIRTAATGARVQMDPNGVRVFNADNDVRTHLSPDGSTFKGEVEADTLVVNEGAEFKGNNTLAQGSKFTLAAGVTDPTAPPVVQPYWDEAGVSFPTIASGFHSLAFDGTNYWTARRTGFWVVNDVGCRLLKINATTGAESFYPVPTSRWQATIEGVTSIGSELFILMIGRARDGDWASYVVVTDLNGTFKREFPYPDAGYSPTNPLTYNPGIGNDGTNIVIAQCEDNGPLNIRTYNKTTGALISSVKDTSDGTKSDITGVYVGNADWGRKLVTVAKKSAGELPSFNPTSGVYDGAATKFNAASPNSTGVVFANGKFRTLDPSGVIHEYADPNTGDGSGDWWAGYGWWTDVDSDGTAETSDYQSRMSPYTRFTWPRRAGIKIVGQPMPTGADYLIPWLAKKTTGPVRTDFHGTAWDYDTGKPIARISALPPDWANTISPPSVNTFPEGTSSVLESASGTFRVQGDGSGHWGPLTMGRNGVMSGLIVTGWATMNVDTGGTSKPYTINLPAGRFSKPPVVWAQPSTSVPELVDIGIDRGSITTSTFTLHFNRTTTTSTIVAWFAMDSE